MKNQLCFSLKVRSGIRTPVYVICEPLVKENEEILVGERRIKATEIANHVTKSVIDFLETQVKIYEPELYEMEGNVGIGINTPTMKREDKE